jgi:hypothetical protein
MRFPFKKFTQFYRNFAVSSKNNNLTPKPFYKQDKTTPRQPNACAGCYFFVERFLT